VRRRATAATQEAAVLAGGPTPGLQGSPPLTGWTARTGKVAAGALGRVGSPGASQPPAPSDPGVTVSRHRALLKRPSAHRVTRPAGRQRSRGWIGARQRREDACANFRELGVSRVNHECRRRCCGKPTQWVLAGAAGCGVRFDPSEYDHDAPIRVRIAVASSFEHPGHPAQLRLRPYCARWRERAKSDHRRRLAATGRHMQIRCKPAESGAVVASAPGRQTLLPWKCYQLS
jgi:hypothetical protein